MNYIFIVKGPKLPELYGHKGHPLSTETESAYQLREPQASYSDYFAPEKEALRAEFLFLEHLSKYINAIAWPDLDLRTMEPWFEKTWRPGEIELIK